MSKPVAASLACLKPYLLRILRQIKISILVIVYNNHMCLKNSHSRKIVYYICYVAPGGQSQQHQGRKAESIKNCPSTCKY